MFVPIRKGIRAFVATCGRSRTSKRHRREGTKFGHNFEQLLPTTAATTSDY